MDWTSWIDPVKSIALQAAAAIRQEQRAGIAVLKKADGSPQSNADRAAETCIAAALRALTPDIPLVAEESAADAPFPDPGQPLWLVDPLDGTLNFLAGDDDYSINIALLVNRRPVFGVIYAPAFGEMFWNGVHSAWYQKRQEVMKPISVRSVPPEGMTMITGRRRKPGQKLNAWMEGRPIANHILLGSALKFGYVAMGRADVYPRLGDTMEWDNAAGEAILRAAGGSVTTLDGKPLPYGQPDLTHRGFIATGGLTPV